MHILLMLDHKSRLKCIYWYAIYLVICVRIDCTHSRSWVAYLTGCGTIRPGGGGSRPGVGPSSMLSSRSWANVGPAGVTVWAVMGGWQGAVCELLSPFEHAKYHYLCKNYHYHYYYSWQSLVKALTSLFLNSGPALSALWTQRCSGGQKKKYIYTTSYTFIPQRDW